MRRLFTFIEDTFKNLLTAGRKENIDFLSEIKPGTILMIYHESAVAKVIQCKCLSNWPKSKKMAFEVSWVNSEGEKYKTTYIRHYDGRSLENALLLNQDWIRYYYDQKNQPLGYDDSETNQENKELSIKELQEKIDEALDKKDYKEVGRLQSKMNELEKKKNKK